jgi:hypothetical protein
MHSTGLLQSYLLGRQLAFQPVLSKPNVVARVLRALALCVCILLE